MSVRAKMRFSHLVITEYGPNTTPQKQAVFCSVYDSSIPEDQKFQKATPWAEAKFNIDNPAALEQLVPGKAYYFDITEVPDAPAS